MINNQSKEEGKPMGLPGDLPPSGAFVGLDVKGPDGPPSKQWNSNQEHANGSKNVQEKSDVLLKESSSSKPVKGASKMEADVLAIPLGRKNADSSTKTGKKIQVDVNHMALELKNYEIMAYHYDCVFVPDKPKFLLLEAMKELFRQKFPGRVPVFDGVKNLYSNGPLIPDDKGLSAMVSVFNEDSQREREFEITIAVVNKINMNDLKLYQSNPRVNPQMALTIMDLALRGFSADRLISSNKKFFTPPAGRVIENNDGLELWHGHFQSASLGWKPFLCIDVVNKGFFEALSIKECITNLFKGRLDQELSRSTRKKLENHLKCLKIQYEIPSIVNSKRSLRVNGVVGSARTEKFVDADKIEWTVEQYFAQLKKCPLKYPYMPCLWVGSREKRVCIPGELCSICPGQSYNKKYNEGQTREMAKEATSTTGERRDRIMDAFGNTGMNSENPYLKEFGISVSGQFERVEGRILDPPLLEYGDNASVRPRKGVWRAPPFLVPMELNNWSILGLNSRVRHHELRSFSAMIAKQSLSYGMKITPTNDIELHDPKSKREVENYFMKRKEKQIIFVCLPDGGDTYGFVKKIAEITVGVLTQCIKGATMKRINPSTIGNLLLKVNAKLNGVNHTFAKQEKPSSLRRPVMIVGADVTHPSPGQVGVPSIAAVAASHDPKAFQYNMVWRMQPKGEIIDELETMMKEQLSFFYSETRYKPEKILFFRDGVSEGEIQKVMSMELSAIRRACKSLENDYEPKITFLMVQKRHHTRFFPADVNDCYDRKNFNLPAGTVVDTEIVHPHETEFLLLSHASLLGTARPTKYRLVWDDSEFYENELEQLSYYLCHMFTRCNRSVSYPAPTYYAHLAAYRARAYLEADRVTNLNDLAGEQNKRKMNEKLMKTSPMFFV